MVSGKESCLGLCHQGSALTTLRVAIPLCVYFSHRDHDQLPSIPQLFIAAYSCAQLRCLSCPLIATYYLKCSVFATLCRLMADPCFAMAEKDMSQMEMGGGKWKLARERVIDNERKGIIPWNGWTPTLLLSPLCVNVTLTPVNICGLNHLLGQTIS